MDFWTLELIYKMIHRAPGVRLGLFLFVSSSFGFEHHHIGYFCAMLEPFGVFHTPSFVWAPLIIEGFYMPLNFVWALLIIEDFLMSPSLGCDPSQGYFPRKSY
jgi:hypothetical protein